MEELDHYAWCGHAALLGTMENNFQNTTDVLRRFAANDGKENSRLTGSWVIGDSDMVSEYRKPADTLG